MIPTLRSLPDPEALRIQLADVYGLAFTGCTLLRSLVNDVYEVVAPDGKYVLKLYNAGTRQPAEILWETGLSAHLVDAGLLVPRVQPLADGSEVGLLEAAEGERPFVLSTFITGTKPEPPFTDDLYADFGRLLATFHEATEVFSSSYPRRPADLQHRLDEPLDKILPRLAPSEGNLCHELATAVRNHLTQYADTLEWGVCHGDVTLDNVLRTDQGLALHDFDLSAPGYRAADFTGVASTPHWDAFAAGYSSKRRLADVEAIPWLAVVGSIFNLRFHLHDKPLIRGTESIHEGWAAAELAALRKAARQLL